MVQDSQWSSIRNNTWLHVKIFVHDVHERHSNIVLLFNIVMWLTWCFTVKTFESLISVKELNHVLTSLMTQRRVVFILNHAAWVIRLSELGVEGLDVAQSVRWDIIVRQSASRPVQIHSQTGEGRRNRWIMSLIIMFCREICCWTWVLVVS